MPLFITDEERASVQIANAGSRDRLGGDEDDNPQRDDEDESASASPFRPKSVETWLDDMSRTIRLAARAKDSVAALAALRSLSIFLTQIRQDKAKYDKIRQELVSHSLALLQPLQARDDILRYLRPGTPRPQLRAQATRLESIAETFGQAFKPTADWLAGRADDRAVVTADLGLVADFRKLNAQGQKQQDFHLSFHDPLASAVRMGQKAGLKVVAIPAFAFPMLTERPSHILSFHSTGVFPGFTHFKRADLPGYLSLDPGGYSGWSSLSQANLADLDLPPLAEATAIFDRLWQDIVAADVSKYTQHMVTDDETPLPDRYVFVALQVPTDRTQAMARFTMDEMVEIVAARFRGTGISVVVKPHPKAPDMDQLGRLLMRQMAGDIVLRFGNIHDLIRGAEAVITINSGVGSETLLHRKPVYCFGGADYDAVAHRITSAEQFNALTDPIRPAVSEADLIRFTAYYRTRFLIERDLPGRLDQAMMERVILPALADRAQ